MAAQTSCIYWGVTVNGIYPVESMGPSPTGIVKTEGHSDPVLSSSPRIIMNRGTARPPAPHDDGLCHLITVPHGEAIGRPRCQSLQVQHL